ncbi:MAG: diguanylate cyclase [Gammaproteobacteria bacterium]|nr:diguanylate cyclase [Gammaproteobacteria bacterium]MBT4449341.1 diguanylate cyclase [Gammaproteobacteria bacterium]MBT7206766.1 diguanylate cyclase [Gammaproteobacteria bacterium]
MNNDFEQKHTISSYHLKQHELVNFLYDRFTVGMMFTMVVALVATILVTFELSLQGLEYRGYIWFAGLSVIQYFRYRLKKRYDQVKTVDYLSHGYWKKRFIVGIYIVALWQGLGAVIAMPMISDNLQFIFHAFLLGLGAGAIAYLATSMVIFGSYLILMILPVTVYLFWLNSPDSFVLGCMHIFMVGAYYFGVRRMNIMINDSLHFRFDNEMLVNDLQRLLNAVAESNKELDELSTTDELTGASNFRAFRVGLEAHRLKHISSKLPLTVIMVNIDYYHEYNSFYGQDMGNKSLTAVANLLVAEIVQKDELVARMNGAEFAIVLPGVSCEGARILMEKNMQLLQHQAIPHERSKVNALLTLSVGICCIPVTQNISSRDLITRADDALRLAKKNGRNRIEIINT